jgi:DNA segregation ATPase FtsK/SpoIIIE-like protein
MKSTELIELVKNLNEAAEKQSDREEGISVTPFSYHHSGEVQYISFFGEKVWDDSGNIPGPSMDNLMRHEIGGFLEAVARLDVPALVALLPEPEPEVSYASEVTPGEEELVAKCIEVIRLEKKASVSLFQRRLYLGYIAAARICDILEARGIIGPGSGAAPREILQLPEAAA